MSKPIITFRTANYSDIPLLKYWDSKPHVITAGVDEDWTWEDNLALESPEFQNLIAILENEPIGFIQIIDPANEPTNYWGEVADNLRAIDIWIGEEKKLGKGYGTQMMNLAIKRCFANRTVTEILIDPLVSNKRAINFYKKLGFEFLEYRVFGKDKCYIMKLSRSNIDC